MKNKMSWHQRTVVIILLTYFLFLFPSFLFPFSMQKAEAAPDVSEPTKEVSEIPVIEESMVIVVQSSVFQMEEIESTGKELRITDYPDEVELDADPTFEETLSPEGLTEVEEEEIAYARNQERIFRECSKETHESYFTDEEREWVAQVVQNEAGTLPLEGKIATVAAVYDRYKDSEFPDSIYAVIHQENQFVSDWCVPSEEAYQAVDEFIYGGQFPEDLFWFRTDYAFEDYGHFYVQIGNTFYNTRTNYNE